MTFFQAPGRMNVFDEHPFKVILDYGHNPAAVDAMCRLVQRMEVKGRRLVVLTAPGDRRDVDIEAIGRLAAGVFDHYVLRRDASRRGRGHDEVPRLLRRALLDAGVADERITLIPNEAEAVDAALRLAQPGDLLLIFGDDLTRCWKQIVYFGREPGGGRPSPPAMVAEPVVEPMPPPVEIEGLHIVRDERGVRLAAEPEEAD
jgi:cyanophycin synthetase